MVVNNMEKDMSAHRREVKSIYLIFLLVFSFIFCGSTYAAGEDKICPVKTVEYPGKDPTMWDGLYAASDGKVYSGLITEGGSAHFYVYDPVKDTQRMLYDIADFVGERGKGTRLSCKIHCRPVEDKEGNIYFATLNNGSGPAGMDFTSWQGGRWFKYDPKTEKLEDLGLLGQKEDGPYPLAIDRERMYLFGIGFTGYLYRFDIKNRVTKNFGFVSQPDVCRGIFCDDEGNIYGSFPIARVWKYDAKKEKAYDLSIRMPYDASIYPSRLNNPTIDRTYDWRSIQWDPVEKVAYGVTCGSGSILFKFDPHDGPEGKMTELAKLCDSKFFGRKDIPYSTLAFALDAKNRRIYYAPSGRPYTPDNYVETFGSGDDHHLVMYDLKTSQRVELGVLRSNDGRRVFGCEGAAVAPDGTLYLCGQVETDPQKATRHTRGTDIPIALRLIIYKPQLN
jgi:hypothetical protein